MAHWSLRKMHWDWPQPLEGALASENFEQRIRDQHQVAEGADRINMFSPTAIGLPPHPTTTVAVPRL